MRMGLDFVKLFPAEVVGGVKMLKALGGPYGNMKFMPTGGISAQNAAEYLALPNVLCCGGSWMVPGGLLDAGTLTPLRRWHAKRRRLIKNDFVKTKNRTKAHLKTLCPVFFIMGAVWANPQRVAPV